MTTPNNHDLRFLRPSAPRLQAAWLSVARQVRHADGAVSLPTVLSELAQRGLQDASSRQLIRNAERAGLITQVGRPGATTQIVASGWVELFYGGDVVKATAELAQLELVR